MKMETIRLKCRNFQRISETEMYAENRNNRKIEKLGVMVIIETKTDTKRRKVNLLRTLTLLKQHGYELE